MGACRELCEVGGRNGFAGLAVCCQLWKGEHVVGWLVVRGWAVGWGTVSSAPLFGRRPAAGFGQQSEKGSGLLLAMR